MIKYIGSKRTLVPQIVRLISKVPHVRSVVDLFTGTTRVAQGLKRAGLFVTANDLASYSEVLAQTYIEQDAHDADVDTLQRKLAHLNRLPGKAGYFTETFCVQSRYFQPKNGARIDHIRNEIDAIAASALERATLLTSLMEAADRVDSTTGLQMAYLKQWAPRASNDLELRMPQLLPGLGKALRFDAIQATQVLDEVDVYYLDPPYNQHSYYSNYHIWESLIRNDEPEVYGIACKRIDCRTTKSEYNSKPRSWPTFQALVRQLRSRYAVVSFNNEGYFAAENVIELLTERYGQVACLTFDFKRYVGAQIGIYNPQGDKVGAIGHLRNKEFLFIAGEGAAEIADRFSREPEAEQLTLV